MESPRQAISPFLNTRCAAEYLQLRPSTLARWRSTGGGPTYHRLGGRVFCTLAGLAEWAESRRRASTAAGRSGHLHWLGPGVPAHRRGGDVSR